jgi:hypothetical protein
LKFVIPLLSFNTIQILADQLFDNWLLEVMWHVMWLLVC